MIIGEAPITTREHHQTNTDNGKIPSLIEQRIRAQVEAEVAPGVAAFHEQVKAAMLKLGVSGYMGPEYVLVEHVRKRRIEQLVDHRIDRMVNQLVAQQDPEVPAQRTAVQAEQDSEQKKPVGVWLVARKIELQTRIREAVAAEAKAFFEETGVNITSLDVQFVRQQRLNQCDCHYIGSVEAGITLGQ